MKPEWKKFPFGSNLLFDFMLMIMAHRLYDSPHVHHRGAFKRSRKIPGPLSLPFFIFTPGLHLLPSPSVLSTLHSASIDSQLISIEKEL